MKIKTVRDLLNSLVLAGLVFAGTMAQAKDLSGRVTCLIGEWKVDAARFVSQDRSEVFHDFAAPEGVEMALSISANGVMRHTSTVDTHGVFFTHEIINEITGWSSDTVTFEFQAKSVNIRGTEMNNADLENLDTETNEVVSSPPYICGEGFIVIGGVRYEARLSTAESEVPDEEAQKESAAIVQTEVPIYPSREETDPYDCFLHPQFRRGLIQAEVDIETLEQETQKLKEQRHNFQQMAVHYGSDRWEHDPKTRSEKFWDEVELIADSPLVAGSPLPGEGSMQNYHKSLTRRWLEDEADKIDDQIKKKDEELLKLKSSRDEFIGYLQDPCP